MVRDLALLRDVVRRNPIRNQSIGLRFAAAPAGRYPNNTQLRWKLPAHSTLPSRKRQVLRYFWSIQRQPKRAQAEPPFPPRGARQVMKLQQELSRPGA